MTKREEELYQELKLYLGENAFETSDVLEGNLQEILQISASFIDLICNAQNTERILGFVVDKNDNVYVGYIDCSEGRQTVISQIQPMEKVSMVNQKLNEFTYFLIYQEGEQFKLFGWD